MKKRSEYFYAPYMPVIRSDKFIPTRRRDKMRRFFDWLGKTILSGLLLLITIAANVVMAGLLIDAFTGKYGGGVKIFCVVFVIAAECGFFILLRIMYKSLWKEN